MSRNSSYFGGLIATVVQTATTSGRRPPQPATSGATHHTGAPVLRGSVEAGTFEDAFFTNQAPGETDKMLRVARKLLDAGRRLGREARTGLRQLSRKEQAIAALTSGTVRVYEELCSLARLNRGRVYPSYEWLEDATGYGRGTIARALRILEELGLLLRQRRFKRIEAEGPGPRYKQTSNVYRLLLPGALLSYLPRWMRPAPVPADALQREADRADDHQHMLSQLSCRDLARATINSGPLARVLANLGARIDQNEREFDNRTQPLIDS